MMKRYLFMVGMTVTGFTSLGMAASVLPAGADDFSSAPEISAASGISAVVNLSGFTKEVDEPSHNPTSELGGEHSAWWSWTAQETGFCTVDTRRTFGTTNAVKRTSLAVYVGTAVDELTLVGSSREYSYESLQPDYQLSSVVFYAEAGKTYYLAADAATAADITGTAFNVVLQVRLVALKKAVRNGLWFLVKDETVDAGTVTVAMTATGRFTGKLVTMLKTYAFKGVIGVDGYATLSFDRPGKPPQPPITLLLDLAGEGAFLVQKDGQKAEGILPEKTVFSSVGSAAAGRLTGILEPTLNSIGIGSVSMTVSSKGMVKGAGTAPDGSAFTFSTAQHGSVFDEYSFVPVHVKLKGKRGVMQLPMAIQETGEKDRLVSEGAFIVRFAAVKAGDVFYPDGLAMGLTVGGTTYLPGSGGRALGFLDGSNGIGNLRVVDYDGELPGGDFMEALTLSESNKYTFDDLTRKPVLKLNVKTGLLTGTILEPSNRKRNIRAVLFEHSGQVYVYGLVTGATVTLQMGVEAP